MELLYSVRRKPLKCKPPRFDSAFDSDTVRPICTISNANIIAFSSPTELSDVDGDTWGGHVYVCDLDTPWDSHIVTSTSHPVSALEWDLEGRLLLVATTVGDVSVHTQKDHLLNEWTCLYSASFPGEHVLEGAFFHNGRRLVVLEKKTDVPITDRIQALRYSPTLKGFGGVASEGVCIVTATGLIGAVQATADGSVVDCLRPTVGHVSAASIAYKTGALLVASVAAGGAGRGCVRVYRCAASRAPPGLAAQPLPALYLPADVPVTVSWSQREEAESLLVGGGAPASLSLWKCTERAHPVHKLLNKGPVPGGAGPKTAADTFNTMVWQKVSMWSEGGASRVVGAAAARAGGALVVATPDGVALLARDSLYVLASRPVVTSAPAEPPASASPSKKAKYGPGVLPGGAPAAVSHVCVSSLGGAAVCVDTLAQLHVFRLAPLPALPALPPPAPPAHLADIPTSMAVQHALGLLEFAAVSGTDCLDILLTLKPAVIEPLYERFTETFHRQPSSFQQFYFHSWLKIRIALCRISINMQSNASSLTSVQMVSAVLAAGSAALRTDLALDDDSEKSIASLESKPEVCGEGAGGGAALGALRAGLQRARDVAVTALAALAAPPAPPAPGRPQGYEMCADPNALSVLRRLVAAWRASGRAGGRAGGADGLSRLLARLAASPGHHHKQDILDECATTAAQWPGGRVWEGLPRCSVAAPHGRPAPLYFEYGVEPEALRYTPEAPAYAQCETTPSLNMDSVTYMYMGGGRRPARWRACGRCGSRALCGSRSPGGSRAAPPPAARQPLQRAYVARFLTHCRCGGKWTLFSNV